jgi:hypothetical protein
MRGENFIYFSVVSGFFAGLIFALFKSHGVFEFLIEIALITMIFYLIALASVALFLKNIDIKRIIFFNKAEAEEILDVQIKELEKKENFILESYEFIKQIEQEEMEIIRKNRK